ncbi:contact-dependent growth inhibition system immunity protein [Ralstonia pseudosolanacearum]|uniref:contact-dependent growth inhibition system immunity protein n=1 Tax=Ralstonia pseudosolanacearum TaxID=1310165 RepID=UPI0018D15CCD|nr:contact-dependent growth inhibition system immunity protein [Ralstonia pseudosolanacearum]
MKKPGAAVTVDFNGDFYRIITMSRGMMSYAEPGAEPIYLDPHVDDDSLGKALREALAKSRQVSVEDFQRIFRSGVVQKLGKEREALAMEKYGYKTRRAMLKKMDTCSVSVVENQIEIQPTHQKSLDGWTVTKDEGPFPLYVPGTATDADLGAALREGFKRTSLYRIHTLPLSA